jgi:hypothetical protein
LPLAGELPIVPEFRSRRALATMYGGFELAPEEVSTAALRALEIEPGTNALRNGLQVLAGLEKGHLEAGAAGDAMARITHSTTGTELVLAVLDKRAGATSSAHADTLARRLAEGAQPLWWLALEALWQTHELAYDGAALLEATRMILAHDRYHRRALQMAMRAAQIINEPIDALEADLELADAIVEPYERLLDEPTALRVVLEPLAGPARFALAQRVLQRAEVNRPDPAIAAWAAGIIVGSPDPAHGRLVATALAALDGRTRDDVIARAAELIDGPAHPLVEVLLAFLDGPEPSADDPAVPQALAAAKEAALVTLAPWAHEPALFDRLMQLLEHPAGASTIEPLCARLLSPLAGATFVVPRLDAAQAVRLARALIALRLRHPDLHVRQAAGRELANLDHAGARSFLLEARADYGTRAAARESSASIDLRALVAALDAAVGGLEPAREPGLVVTGASARGRAAAVAAPEAGPASGPPIVTPERSGSITAAAPPIAAKAGRAKVERTTPATPSPKVDPAQPKARATATAKPPPTATARARPRPKATAKARSRPTATARASKAAARPARATAARKASSAKSPTPARTGRAARAVAPPVKPRRPAKPTRAVTAKARAVKRSPAPTAKRSAKLAAAAKKPRPAVRRSRAGVR